MTHAVNSRGGGGYPMVTAVMVTIIMAVVVPQTHKRAHARLKLINWINKLGFY